MIFYCGSMFLTFRPSKWKVADLGCGDAIISRSVKQNVISIDMVAANPSVTVCDMANTSIESKSVDVVVFCLSLMGSNISDFLLEANRILVDG